MYLTCMGLYVGLVQHHKKSGNTHTHAEGGREGVREERREKKKNENKRARESKIGYTTV